MRFAVVMSGGSGRRFWPLSRKARAKQLIPLFGGKSLLELTIERLTPLFTPENTIVVTQREQYAETARLLERFSGVPILCEPVGKNTAPCTVLAVKDRLLGHNPLAAIYTIDSYYRSLKGDDRTA